MPKRLFQNKFSLQHRTWYPCVFCILVVIVLSVSSFLPAEYRISSAITLLTGATGVVGFLYSQHAQALHLFRELFREFNARYDALNEKLNRIKNHANGQNDLDHDDKDVLCDYFNLCAEEHIFNSAGCIDQRVWDAWRKGMQYFAQNAAIRQFWKEELEQGSYYGFPLDLLNSTGGPATSPGWPGMGQ